MLVGADDLSLTEAYRRVYNAGKYSEHALNVEASRLAQKPDVALRIDAIRKMRIATAENEMKFDLKKLIETYLAIAFTDPNELTSTKAGACRHCHGEEHAYQWVDETEYLHALRRWEKGGQDTPAPDPSGGFGYRAWKDPVPECDGCGGEGVPRVVVRDTTKLSPGARLLYQGSQQTKEGIKVLFANRDKALENLGRIIGAFDDKLRVDLEAKAASVNLSTTDPAEAAEAYARFIKGS